MRSHASFGRATILILHFVFNYREITVIIRIKSALRDSAYNFGVMIIPRGKGERRQFQR